MPATYVFCLAPDMIFRDFMTCQSHCMFIKVLMMCDTYCLGFRDFLMFSRDQMMYGMHIGIFCRVFMMYNIHICIPFLSYVNV